MSTITTPEPGVVETSRTKKLAWRVGAIASVTAGIVFVSAARAFAGPFVPVQPDPNAPGAKALNQLTQYVLTWVLDIAVIGAFASLIAMVGGKIFGEHAVTKIGKTGLITAIAVAALAGGMTAILNAAWVAGSQG
jgi:hypothetical protein